VRVLLISKNEYIKNVKKVTKGDFEKGQVVLIGDCYLDKIDLTHFFPNQVIYNNSVCGDTVDRLKETINRRAIRYRPKKLFISIGSNDLAFGPYHVKEVFEKIIEVVSIVKTKSKNTEVFIITTLPVYPALNKKSISSMTDKLDNHEVTRLNHYLKKYARSYNLTIIDAHKHLKNEFDQLCSDYTNDGYKLNDLGYERFFSLIKLFV
jgi:lysophospholipase L1-like esterase